jgi:eukaryotic-like serine/threonine-protein kinase
MHPREFGDYRIVKLLPLGGMGRVYLALHARTNQPVALKLIERGTDPDREEIVEAERRGAKLQERLCRLDDRIADILGYGELDEYFFIEMEYVEGEDLSEVLRRGPLGIPFAARIGRDLCETLSVAHTFSGEIDGHQYRGVVHGDIKPRNVRITPDGEVRVLDFGIAKALSLTRSFTQNHFGSSQYSSPERLNTGDVDVASDLWSVGVVLYEIVTARPYFEGDSGPKLDHIIRNYRQVRPLPPHLPAPFQAILRKALHPDPAARYAAAQAFADDLTAFLEGRTTDAERMPPDDGTRRTVQAGAASDEAATRRTTVPAGAPSDATRRTGPAPASAPAASGVRPHRPLSRRERQIRFFAGALLVLILGAMTYNEYAVWRAGAALRRDLETERLTDMDSAWQRFQSIADRNYLPLVLRGARNAVLDRMISSADRVITDYRSSEAPSVSENDWLRAQAILARALQLDPGDKEIRGKMYLCDGHINRIRGTARSNGKMLNDARARFEAAEELIPKSPDPYLGLARLYVYSLKDVEKAEQALKAAGKRGHPVGRREKAQLGDGYRDRAERLLREADKATGLPEEKDYLERARDDFERAQEYYRDIVPYAGSANSLRRVLDFSDHVELRLKIIREGA